MKLPLSCAACCHWFLAIVGLANLISIFDIHAATPLQQAYIKASNTGNGDVFGRVIAASGTTVVISAYQEDSNANTVNGNQADNTAANAGAAYVFVRQGTNWMQQAYLKPSNADTNDTFGFSVAISGDTIVIGSSGEDSNAIGINGDASNNSRSGSGAAYVFVRNGTNWTQQAYLKASNSGANDAFGYSVAVSGDTVVVGSLGEDSNATGVDGDQLNNSAGNSGAAYVFTRTGTNWAKQAYIKASNTRSGSQFGNSMALDGDTLVVGSYGEASNATGVNGNQSDITALSSGAAYVFVRNGTTWSQQAYLKASNTGAQDWFGLFVTISRDTIAVGAPFESSSSSGVNGDGSNNNALNSGAAYVFVRNGTNWTPQAYIKASNPTGGGGAFSGGDNFGAVAVSGNILVVGAPGESSNAIGINGNQFNETSTNSGAAYVFARTGTNWTQQAYIKASNNGANDALGISVATSGDTLAVGAFGESSNATGVNGDQANDLIPTSGAAYIFTGFVEGPSLTLAPDGSGGYYLRFTGIPIATYRVLRAGSLMATWETAATLIAPPSGLVEFHDITPPAGQAFYRTAQP